VFESFWNILAIPSAHFNGRRVLGNTIASKANLLRRGVVVDCMSCLCGEIGKPQGICFLNVKLLG